MDGFEFVFIVGIIHGDVEVADAFNVHRLLATTTGDVHTVVLGINCNFEWKRGANSVVAEGLEVLGRPLHVRRRLVGVQNPMIVTTGIPCQAPQVSHVSKLNSRSQILNKLLSGFRFICQQTINVTFTSKNNV